MTFDYKSIAASIGILSVGIVLFVGLKDRLLVFAERANLPQLAFKPMRLIIRYAILTVSVVIALRLLGFPVDAIFASLAAVLGLVAIGFVAVWSVLSNILCTFVLILFKPFSIGDELEFPTDAVAGKVVDLTLIFTTLRTASGDYFQIPNNLFFQKVFKRRIGEQVISLEEQLHHQKPVE